MKLPTALAILLLTGVGMYMLLKDYGDRDVYHEELVGTLECMGTRGVTAGVRCIPGIRTTDDTLYAIYIGKTHEDIFTPCQGLPVFASGTSTALARFKDPGHYAFKEQDWKAFGATRLLFPEALQVCAT